MNSLAAFSLKRLGVVILILGLCGCQSLRKSAGLDSSIELVDANTLAGLQPATLEYEKSIVDAVSPEALELSLQNVIDSYSALLPLLKEPDTQMRVLHRLADLELAKGESLMVDEAVDKLDIAISAYESLLETYPTRPGNDQVYYQLAKSYDLQGKSEAHLNTLDLLVAKHPDSELITEAQFRRGEILFNQGEYESAQSAFEAVISAGESVFLANANYMKGWSLFKQSAYQPALLSYTKVLDLVMPAEQQIEDIDSRNRTMVEDLLRVMGLSFSYLGGADSIEQLFTTIGPKGYEILVYERYSELLLDKEHYTDAIAVYRRFIDLHPLSIWSPRYQINIINTLKLAGYKKDILEEKKRFVAVYGKDNLFWAEHDDEKLLFTKTQLEWLLPELADLYYVKGQQNVKSLNDKTNAKKANADITKKLNKDRRENFQQASIYYAAFADTFPLHVETPNMLFLQAESHLQLLEWIQAIAVFERTAYEFDDHSRAAEAAYASILAFIDYALTWSSEPAEQFIALQTQQQQSRLRFVRAFANDSRAVDVLSAAMTWDYQQNSYAETVVLAQQLIEWQPVPDPATVLEARILKAHSYYALKQFPDAEQAYQDVLLVMAKKDPRYLSTVENLAATVFQQAEIMLAAGNMELAISEFLRVGSVAPNSVLRSSAEYDAANYLIELKQWPHAIEVLLGFRQRYPQDKLQVTLPAKLALAYRETQQWELAAQELNTLYERAKTEQEKQDILYIVAELYDKAENRLQAILSYRSYANNYPDPADTYMEAANRLSELYLITDKPLKRRFWLAKQMKKVDAAPNAADDRMRYLAAGASAVLANDAYIQYSRIKLALPLNKAMTKKTKALKKAMAAYQKTASYGVSAYSTEAGYRMADLYARLSTDLMESDRPSGLNELELEQYDILLEEQTFPFEDSAIDIHEQNASRSWAGIYDEWVKNSFASLKKLLPGRYAKDEVMQEAFDAFN